MSYTRLKREQLAPRHVEVLKLFAGGHTRLSAAAALNIGDETVKTYLEIIRGRLNARNTTHAVAIAIREGYIT